MIQRKDFAKLPQVCPFPNLLDVQLASYRDFLQQDLPKTKREPIGLQGVFMDVFPIESPDKRYALEFLNYTLGTPKYDIAECRRRGMTYGAPLKVKIRLTSAKETKEQEVYFYDLPLMTPTGTFIINGDERVVISQLHRSPGVSFEEEALPSGKYTHRARIIPYRGAWIEIEFDSNGVLFATIDQHRRIPLSTFIRAFQTKEDTDFISYFKEKDSPEVKLTQERDQTKSRDEALIDIFKKLRPGDPPVLENARLLFQRSFQDPKRYDLGRVGRFIINRKLDLKVSLEERLLDLESLIAVTRHLLKLHHGEGQFDDIDHLGNRRVRTVAELLSNQIRIGLARLERAARERMASYDLEHLVPHNLINTKHVSNVVKDFFGRSQLSQFMDQTNPLSELTHKRRLSALGPGGLSRERAGFEVRDVHHSHYGRVCPIETPEGPNIGLITSLSTYARINQFGFIETPYRKVERGRATNRIEYLSADLEDNCVIAQANAQLDKKGYFVDDLVLCRYRGDFPKMPPEKIDYMDVSPCQLVSIAASLIPHLEHDDANRALMGSNMQRQAVPLLNTEAPLIATGMEERTARDSGAMVIARNSGQVTAVDAGSVYVEATQYKLRKFERSNASTCINQRPIVRMGQRVKAGDVLADGPGTENGELALGRNVLVAFMPWRGYNFEDAIIISEKLVREDVYTSIHIERFEVESRETRLGNEEITRDIPNVGEEALKDLDETGIVRIGAEVKAGDILVGKVTPKSETELSPEEKLLRAIFGEKAGDVRDVSLTVPPGIEGIVVDVKVFSRKETRPKTKEEMSQELKEIEEVRSHYEGQIELLKEDKLRKLTKLLLGKKLSDNLLDAEGKRTVIKAGKVLRKSILKKLLRCDMDTLKLEGQEAQEAEAKRICELLDAQLQDLIYEENREIERAKRGDELPAGVLKRVVVHIASRRKVSVGDKMAGRHGNKGVVAKILPEEDMPFMPDGTPIEIVLNPLGVPSRMNVGQILETHLGWAAKALGLYIASPIFDGALESEIKDEMKKANLPPDGCIELRDGFTGRPFDQKVTVGYIYIMKLAHLVDDKIHARSIGPYSLVTQQPLGGKAQFGGQRLGEMEVWALEAYGAAYTLQEFLTVKSDDVQGRTRIYEAIVKGENALEAGVPESFNVLIKELQGLGIEVLQERKK